VPDLPDEPINRDLAIEQIICFPIFGE